MDKAPRRRGWKSRSATQRMPDRTAKGSSFVTLFVERYRVPEGLRERH